MLLFNYNRYVKWYESVNNVETDGVKDIKLDDILPWEDYKLAAFAYMKKCIDFGSYAKEKKLGSNHKKSPNIDYFLSIYKSNKNATAKYKNSSCWYII